MSHQLRLVPRSRISGDDPILHRFVYYLLDARIGFHSGFLCTDLLYLLQRFFQLLLSIAVDDPPLRRLANIL